MTTADRPLILQDQIRIVREERGDDYAVSYWMLIDAGGTRPDASRIVVDGLVAGQDMSWVGAPAVDDAVAERFASLAAAVAGADLLQAATAIPADEDLEPHEHRIVVGHAPRTSMLDGDQPQMYRLDHAAFQQDHPTVATALEAYLDAAFDGRHELTTKPA